jgi:outer membrane protein
MRLTAVLGAAGVLLISLGLLNADAAGPTAPTTKVGYVDLQRTLEKTKVGRAEAQALEKEKGTRQKDLDKKKTDLDAAVEEFKKQAPVLKADVKRQRQAELEEQAYKYQELFMQSQQELLAMERKATQKVFKKAAKVIEGVAKRDGFTMVIEKNEGAVLWADNAFDITDEVNKRLDAGEGEK